MIAGLTFDYAFARVAARLAQRPDERLWLQTRSARSVSALLEAVRTSPAASSVSGIPPTGDPEVIELAFRQQLRTRVDEVAAWSPDAWQAAVQYVRHLVDLPAVMRLMQDERPPRWIANDPVLASYSQDSLAERHRAILAGPLAPVASAIQDEPLAHTAVEPLARALLRIRSGPVVHRALSAWESAWRARWPRTTDDDRAALEDLVRVTRRHVLHFGTLKPEDTAAARQNLAVRLMALLHRASSQPAALFAYLALFALDLERLRGEFVTRARLGASA